MLRIMKCTVLAVMVITFKDQNNIILQEIKLLSSNPDLMGSKNSTGKLQNSLYFSTLILLKPDVRIQSTAQ